MERINLSPLVLLSLGVAPRLACPSCLLSLTPSEASCPWPHSSTLYPLHCPSPWKKCGFEVCRAPSPLGDEEFHLSPLRGAGRACDLPRGREHPVSWFTLSPDIWSAQHTTENCHSANNCFLSSPYGPQIPSFPYMATRGHQRITIRDREEVKVPASGSDRLGPLA